MNKPIFIIGAGGHAKVLLECLQQNSKIEIGGFLEIDKKLIGTALLEFSIFDQEIILKKYSAKNILLANGIGSVNIPALRSEQFKKLKKMGYDFYTVIHPTSYYSVDVVIGEGSQLLARTTVLTGTRIGCNTIINTSASIDHDCAIGNHVHIAPGAVLSGEVVIEDNCHIGAGATIIQGISVGANSLIAAGAVVVENLPKNSRVAGVPAKQIQTLELV
ncbi:MAG: hypothetical protein A3E81_01565 [Gammaproteobacteria bacterium RIFCSPHIGHO2_12_FULL_36_30]|nr:MAG: hypothetical protein A3E81_01565 [Gammaproteobacteria bacterium RIFCSPHIGHO2_12_FULL_36_30]